MSSLQAAVQRLAQLQRRSLDRHELAANIELLKATSLTPRKTLESLKSKLNWKSVHWLKNASVDPSHLPCLALDHHGEWRVLQSFNSQAQWVFEGSDGETTHHSLIKFALAKINFNIPFERSTSPVWHLIKRTLVFDLQGCQLMTQAKACTSAGTQSNKHTIGGG